MVVLEIGRVCLKVAVQDCNIKAGLNKNEKKNFSHA